MSRLGSIGTWTGILIVAGTCRGADEPGGGRKGLVAQHYERRTIYHSPLTPGYTCWVGAWIMPDDSLMASCTQATAY